MGTLTPGLQVAASQARGMPACYLGSAQRNEGVAAGAWRGDYQLVYLTPELATRSLQRIKSLNETSVRGALHFHHSPTSSLTNRKPHKFLNRLICWTESFCNRCAMHSRIGWRQSHVHRNVRRHSEEIAAR